MNLFAIIAATLVAGIGSVWIAALLLRVGVRSGGGGVNPQHLLSLAAGALMATAFMHLLPEAFESGIEPAVLFGCLLFGLVFFFLLDKAELWHHGHEHHHGEADPPAPAPAVDRDAPVPLRTSNSVYGELVETSSHPIHEHHDHSRRRGHSHAPRSGG